MLNLFQHLPAQNKQIDSLKQVIRSYNTSPLGRQGGADTNQVKALNKLSWKLLNTGNYDTALILANQALKLAQSFPSLGGGRGWFNWAGNAYSNIGAVYYYHGNYPEALKNYFASLKIREEINDKQGIAASYNNIGGVYYSHGNYPEALKNYFASLKIREEIKDKQGMAVSYNNIGLVYYYQGNYPEALKNYFASLKIREEMGDKQGIAASYNNIGSVYHSQGNAHPNPSQKAGLFNEALKNHFASLKIREELGDKQGIASSYNNIGNVYYSQGKAHTNSSQKDGLAPQKDGLYNEALKMYFASLKIMEEIGDKAGTESSLVNLSLTYKDLKKYKEAEAYSLKALSLATEIGDLESIKDATRCLSQVYTATSRHKQALVYYKAYITANDTLFNEENTKKTIQMSMTYEFDKKEMLAKTQQDIRDKIQEAEAKKQRIVLILVSCFLVLVLGLAVVIFRSLRINQHKNKIITEQKALVEKQKHLVEEKQKEILDSIRYAKRIQTALITSERYIEKSLNRLMKK